MKSRTMGHKGPLGWAATQTHLDSHRLLHPVGFLVGTIEVGAPSVAHDLAKVTYTSVRIRAAAAGCAGCRHAVATLSTRDGQPVGPRKGSPPGFEAPNPGNPQGRRAREELFVSPELRKSRGRPGRLGRPPGTPARPCRPLPSPNQKRKEPGAASPPLPLRGCGEVAARLQACGPAAL